MWLYIDGVKQANIVRDFGNCPILPFNETCTSGEKQLQLHILSDVTELIGYHVIFKAFGIKRWDLKDYFFA